MPDPALLAPVFPGWNVWAVYELDDLPFSLLMVGVDRDRQLRIWVEDAVRLHAPGATVADPVDLKGPMIEILAGVPEGLKSAARKESVPGPPMLTDGPASRRVVRFFNRGAEARLPWPHDGSFLLDEVYTPDAHNPATSGPGPATGGSAVTAPAAAAAHAVGDVAKVVGAVLVGGAVLYGVSWLIDHWKRENA